MKFDTGNHVFISKDQIVYLQVKHLPNKRMAKQYPVKYDNFFCKDKRA